MTTLDQFLTDDELEARLRVTLTTVVPTLVADADELDQMEHDTTELPPRAAPSGPPRRPRWLVAAAVAAAIAGIGSLLLATRGGDTGPPATQDTGPSPSATATTVVGEPDHMLRELVEPLLPDGFTVISTKGDTGTSGATLTAYDRYGRHVDVYVSLGGGDQLFPEDGDGEVPVPGVVEGSVDQAQAVTTTNDAVWSTCRFGNSLCSDLPFGPAIDVRPIVGGVAAAVDLSRLSEPWSQVSRPVATDVFAVVRPSVTLRLGDSFELLGEASTSASWAERSASAPGLVVTIEVTATDVAFNDTAADPRTDTHIAMISRSGWLLVATAVDYSGGVPTMHWEDLLRLLRDAGDDLDVWLAQQDPRTATTAIPNGECGTYLIQRGDSLNSIAERHSLTLDELMAYNRWPIDQMLMIGSPVELPCPAAAAGVAPPDRFIDDAASYATSAIETTNGVVRSSDRLTYTIVGGFNGEYGSGSFLVLVTTFDGEPVRTSERNLDGVCSEPTVLVDDLTSLLERIPFRCGPDGQVAYLDVFSLQVDLP